MYIFLWINNNNKENNYKRELLFSDIKQVVMYAVYGQNDGHFNNGNICNQFDWIYKYANYLK